MTAPVIEAAAPVAVDLTLLGISLNVLFPILGVLLILTLVAYLAFSGLFAKVDISTREPSHGRLTVAYRTARGPYKTAGDLFTEAVCLMPHRNTIGLYYDDPDSMPAEELRFAVGSILWDSAESTSGAKEDEMQTMMEHGYRIVHLPRPNFAVLSEFPFRTTLSIYIAIFKVYPKLKEYIAARGLCAYPAIEIYTDNEIQFMMPLSRQEEFFVPEFADDEVSIATTENSSYAANTDARPRRINGGDGPSKTDSKGDDAVFAKPKSPAASKNALNKMSKSNSVDDDTSTSSEFEDLGKELVK